MSSDPERPIEKLLRDAAKERREQGGESWDLHPANRRLLQQEVARKFRSAEKPAPGGILNWLGIHRWASALGGVAAVALVALVVWLSVPRHSAEKNAPLLARNDNNPAPALNDKLSSAKTEAMDDRKLAQSAVDEGKVTKKQEIATAPRDSVDKDLGLTGAPALQKAKPAETPSELDAERQANQALVASDASGPTPAASAEAAFRKRYGGLGGTLPQATPAPASAPASLAFSASGIQQATTPAQSSLSAAGLEPLAQNTSRSLAATAVPESESQPLDSQNNVTQFGYFAVNQSMGREGALAQRGRQISSTAGANKSVDTAGVGVAPAPVLSYFRIEQSGTQLRVIDRDGSVYAGPLQAAAQVSGRVAEVEELTRRPQAFRAGNEQNTAGRSTALPRTKDNSVTAGYAFQVVGTNHTLKQQVVFSGIITGLTNTNVQLRNENGPKGQAGQSIAAPNARVSGKAFIGAQQVNIEAVPAPAPN